MKYSPSGMGISTTLPQLNSTCLVHVPFHLHQLKVGESEIAKLLGGKFTNVQLYMYCNSLMNGRNAGQICMYNMPTAETTAMFTS